MRMPRAHALAIWRLVVDIGFEFRFAGSQRVRTVTGMLTRTDGAVFVQLDGWEQYQLEDVNWFLKTGVWIPRIKPNTTEPICTGGCGKRNEYQPGPYLCWECSNAQK